MIVDTSALIAILRAESDAARFAAALAAAAETGDVRMSVVNYLEAAVLVDAARDAVASRRFDQLVRAAEIVLVPATAAHAQLARAAYRDFGKGSGHPARLNFGDCFAYALAAESGESLLFKGDDFVHTDVTRA